MAEVAEAVFKRKHKRRFRRRLVCWAMVGTCLTDNLNCAVLDNLISRISHDSSLRDGLFQNGMGSPVFLFVRGCLAAEESEPRRLHDTTKRLGRPGVQQYSLNVRRPHLPNLSIVLLSEQGSGLYRHFSVCVTAQGNPEGHEFQPWSKAVSETRLEISLTKLRGCPISLDIALSTSLHLPRHRYIYTR